MSKFETLQSLKNEIRELKEKLATLETAEPTEKNLAKVEAITSRAKEIRIYAKQYAGKYGMHI